MIFECLLLKTGKETKKDSIHKNHFLFNCTITSTNMKLVGKGHEGDYIEVFCTLIRCNGFGNNSRGVHIQPVHSLLAKFGEA